MPCSTSHQRWMSDSLDQRGMGDISLVEAAFRHTLTADRELIVAISQAFAAIHYGEGRLACDESLDRLVAHLTPHVAVKPATAMTDSGQDEQGPRVSARPSCLEYRPR
jgi:hypothetical protein